MPIASFSKINTRIRPGMELATISVHDGAEDLIQATTVQEELESIRHSIDGVAITGEGCDPLELGNLYSTLKSIKVRGMPFTLVSSGKSHENLDDLVGAGYVGFLNLELCSPMDSEQEQCIEVMRDNDAGYMVTVTVSKDSFDEASMRELAGIIPDAKHLVIRNAKGKDALSQKDLVSLTKSLKGLVKDIRVV